ncbi:RNA polymerase subunit sigma [Siphonobacter sp. BAB-5405]|nr:RNA polymerase subunit sigma [Siphonobacter sp. BAB-5405]
MLKEERQERELVDRLVLKEPSAWKELYDAYAGNLSVVGSRYLREKEDVRDILQNSFIKMFHSMASFEFRGKGSLRAWMTQIMVHESLKHLKQQAKLDFTTDVAEVADFVSEEEPDLELFTQKELLGLIQSLPLGYRTVFNLYVFEQKSHKEIAMLLGIKESSSASQYHRAKQVLMDKLTELKTLKLDAT